MAEQSVVCVYDSMTNVENAVKKLKESGIPASQVSVVSQNLQSEKEVHGYAAIGAETGAFAGGLFGLLVGAAFFWVPGAGLTVIAGSLASMLLGGVEGALAGAVGGGMIGLLLGDKVSKEHIGQYEELLKGRNHLVIVQGSIDEANKAYNILKDTDEVELDLHLEPAS